MHFTSGTTVILRSAPKLNSVTIGLAYVFRLKHYLRFLGRFDISPHSLLQLAERFVRSVQELNFSIVGHSRWSFKLNITNTSTVNTQYPKLQIAKLSSGMMHLPRPSYSQPLDTFIDAGAHDKTVPVRSRLRYWAVTWSPVPAFR